ncbi:MAG: hypothetical protein KAW39_04295 [Thermoplasmata archaeon]|nr:hypothetical protein [Thermoplasmata archaeon]
MRGDSSGGKDGVRLSVTEIVSFVVATLVPFLVIAVLLSPLSSGIHGAAHADYIHDYGYTDVVDPVTNTTARTDFHYGSSTGWVFCNGKVRFFGEVNIRDTNVVYTIDEAHWSGKWSVADYQTIHLSGTRGEMVEGFPYFLLGFFGTVAGLAMWSAWIVSRRTGRYDDAIFVPGAMLSVFSVGAVLFFPTCLIAMLVFPALLVAVLLIYKKRLKLGRRAFAFLTVLIGLPLLVWTASFLIDPNHCWGMLTGLCSYSFMAAVVSMVMGTVGLISSGALVGFGLGKMTYIGQEEETEERS